ncbi:MULTISPECIES: VanZ family protein [Cytobacillus]|uniref:VanZ family protein n=1 Tax=Cytobacillus TaxID=2675230 RepID=UPI0020411507|nr:VanZ family protein [Cytobacillus firmus]MCM3704835.1 VanZ family protein [Cytobacillus firmus]
MDEISIMFTIKSWYVLLPLSIGVLIGFIFWINKRKKPVNIMHYVTLISFVIYLLCVMHLVFFPIDVNIGRYANQTPWYKSINAIPILTIDIKTFLLNILMMLPLGVYIPLLIKNMASIKKAATLGLMFSLSFELIQLLIRVTLGSGRSSDINDIIANTAGTVIGFMIINKLYKVPLFKKIFQHLELRIMEV